MTLAVISEAIPEYQTYSARRYERVKYAVEAAASIWLISPDHIRAKLGSRTSSFPKGAVALVCKDIFGISYKEIGRKLGGFDHSTIMYHRSKFLKATETDEHLAAKLSKMRRWAEQELRVWP